MRDAAWARGVASGSALQQPASQPWHRSVRGAPVHKTQAAVGIYSLSHSYGVCAGERGAPGMCEGVRVLSLVSAWACQWLAGRV